MGVTAYHHIHFPETCLLHIYIIFLVNCSDFYRTSLNCFAMPTFVWQKKSLAIVIIVAIQNTDLLLEQISHL